ncbi:hypothetical protein ACFLWZ_04770 [Chloroflexota bacterium]
MFKDDDLKGKTLMYIPPLSRVAWEEACTNGYIKPDDAFCSTLRHTYKKANNFVYLMNEAIDIKVKSTLPLEQQTAISSGLIALMENLNKSQIPLLLEAKAEIESRFNISGEEVDKIKTELRERVLKYRVPTPK